MVRFTLAVLLAVASPMAAQVCEVQWRDDFTGDRPPGFVMAMAEHDNGGGSVLWMATASHTDGQRWVCTYDGGRIRLIGELTGQLTPGSSVIIGGHAICEHDDGSGNAIYVAGNFTHIDGVECNGIARYHNGQWAPLSTGADREVLAIVSFNTPEGPRLFAAGEFHRIGGVQTPYLAAWDGHAWIEFGTPKQSTGRAAVRALTTWDDGHGEALYLGGTFDSIGGVDVRNIAKWNGQAWTSLGEGLQLLCCPGQVRGLTAHTDSTGQRWLFARGDFTRSGEVLANRMARWNGQAWLDASAGLGERHKPLTAMGEFRAATHNTLYGGGEIFEFGQAVATGFFHWTGEQWSLLSRGQGYEPSVSVDAIQQFESIHGDHLYIGGRIGQFENVPIRALGLWDGQRLMPVPTENPIVWDEHRFSVVEEAGQRRLYITGPLRFIDGRNIQSMAIFDGVEWTQGPLEGLQHPDHVLGVFTWDDGSGPALYGRGPSIAASSSYVTESVAVYRNGRWEGLHSSFQVSPSIPLQSFDDGHGQRLFGGSMAEGALGWDGQSWRPPADVRFPWAIGAVRGLASIQEASVQTLYLGGQFIANLTTGDTFGLARFRHGVWERVDLPGGGRVIAFNINQEGGADVLYILASDFMLGADLILYRLQNDELVPITPQPTRINSPVLQWFDDGGGRDLYVLGDFDVFQGVPANRIATWNGQAWSPLDLPYQHARVTAAADFEYHGRPALWLAGSFTANRVVGSSIAIIQGCHTCYPDCDESTGQGVLDIFDFLCFANRFAVSDPYACDCDLTTGPGVCDVLDFLCFGNAFTGGCL